MIQGVFTLSQIVILFHLSKTMAVDYSRQQDGDDKNGKAVKETQDDESNTKIVSSISSVSVTVERKPFMRSDDDDELTDYGQLQEL